MLQFLTSRKLIFVAAAILFLTWLMFLTANRTRPASAESFLQIAVTPVQQVFTAVGNSAQSAVRTISELRRLSVENRRLAEEADYLAMQNQTLRGLALENEHLRAMLGLREHLPHEITAVEVIARNPSNWYSRLTINKGSAAGLKRDMPVIAAGGVIGRIIEVTRGSAQVLLLTDSISQIGGKIERTGAHVLIRGKSGSIGECEVLPLRDADFRAGDAVVTWEESEFFPPGLVIGTITSAKEGQGGLPLQGSLKTAAKPNEMSVLFVITVRASATAP